MRLTTIAATALLTTGCVGHYPELVSPTDEGCQVRAGYAVPKGVVGAAFGNTSISSGGAAATIVGVCPEDFRVYARHNGMTACRGEREWCEQEAAQQPIGVTPAQLRQMVAPVP